MNNDPYNYAYGCCPHCDSTRLKRQHRGFIRKHILKTPPMFICTHCAEILSRDEIKYKKAFQADFNQHPKPSSYT